MKNAPKHLKIHSSYTGKIKPDRTAHVLPKIVLSGEWLSHAGFHPGDAIMLLIEKQKLVIEKLK